MVDPHPTPTRFVGQFVSFDRDGKRLVGIVISQTFIGPTARGAIPDYELEVRGGSGAVLKISLVESYASFR